MEHNEAKKLATAQKGNLKLMRRCNELSDRLEATEKHRDKLVTELVDYKEGCEGLKLTIVELRPYAECYRRVCETLGIEKNILGYVERIQAHRDKLLVASKMGLIALESLIEICKKLGNPADETNNSDSVKFIKSAIEGDREHE